MALAGRLAALAAVAALGLASAPAPSTTRPAPRPLPLSQPQPQPRPPPQPQPQPHQQEEHVDFLAQPLPPQAPPPPPPPPPPPSPPMPANVALQLLADLVRQYAIQWVSESPHPVRVFASVGGLVALALGALKSLAGWLLQRWGLAGPAEDRGDAGARHVAAALADAVAGGDCLQQAACHLGHVAAGWLRGSPAHRLLAALPPHAVLDAFRDGAGRPGDCQRFLCAAPH